jgi:hypothetical protein
MNKLVKVALAGSVLAASTGAYASGTTLPSTDTSNLLFYVTNTATKNTYTEVLTQLIGTGAGSYFNSTQANASTTQGSVNTLTGDSNFSLNLSADTALTSFIGTGGTAYKWGIIAGAYANPQDTQGNTLVVTTSTGAANATHGVLNVTDTNLGGAVISDIQSDVVALNAQTFDGTNGTVNGIFGTTASAGNELTLYGAATSGTDVALGGSSTLYGLTTNGLGNTKNIVYSLGSATFSSATDILSFTGNPGGSSVPLPAAAWLFGSGLLSLLGISRRRQTSAALTAAI